MNHTPEKWRIRELAGDKEEFFIAADPPPSHPLHGRTKDIEIMSDEHYPTKRADAERIVACVNAMEGIADPAALIHIIHEMAKCRGDFEESIKEMLARFKDQIV